MAINESAAPRSLRERQRQEREQLILDAAAQVFADKGYHQATIEEIAARVGIAKGTVYLHFPTKDDLLLALLERLARAFAEMVEHIAAQPLSARERLEQIVSHTYAQLHDRRVHLLLSLGDQPGVSRQRLEEHAALRAQTQRAMQGIRAILEQGQRAGEFDAHLPLGVMLHLFLALLSPRKYGHLIKDLDLPPAELARTVLRVYLCGILARPQEDRHHP
ncbi:TetR/AcrR family transcriptional regulator [Kallotenue papyrolyticum]|uniref:TetR/AcrR family transcriptional regulator n=1 Tax=Kallotenue papyrolyticum TaxID=1325125 RepID=UPI000492D5FC|nr:TetR/AcrR family transcriptional regulator [Kallotenue papyrolyticum]